MKSKILVSIMAIGLVAMLAGTGLYAYFTDTATSTGNTFTSGTLYISAGTGSFSAGFDNMKPGDTVTFTIIVQNDGTLPLDYTITTAIGGDLSTGSTPCVARNIQVDGDAYAPKESLTVEGGGDWKDIVTIDVFLPWAAGNNYMGLSGTLDVTFDAIQQ